MDRKEMVKTLGKHFSIKPKYQSAQSFAYELRTADEIYTIDRYNGIINRERIHLA